MSGRPPLDPRTEAAALGLAIDAAAARASRALAEAGVPNVLLKGASLAGWLYGADEPRAYGDIDLLVSPAGLTPAGPVLERLGYAPRPPGPYMPLPTHTEHAEWWIRRSDGMNLDLHHTIQGATVPREELWTVLSTATEPMRVGQAEVAVLDEPARAMHVALHAAAHGRAEAMPLDDLRRALRAASDATWREAAALAGRLGADGPFAAGLVLVPEGAALAQRIGVRREIDVDTALHAASAPYSAHFVDRLAGAPGIGRKLRMAAAKVVPNRRFMRAWYPVARRGPLGLAAAYALRQAWLVRRGVPAVVAWARARRVSRDSSSPAGPNANAGT